MRIIKPQIEITIAGTDVTADLTPFVESVNYTDQLKGKSDEIEVNLNNSDGRFSTNWYFSKGDRISLKIGYDNNLLDCGGFTIDEIGIRSPPKMVTVRALAAGINSPLRTKRNVPHESKSLLEIANEIASRNDLKVIDGTTSTTRVVFDVKSERLVCENAALAIEDLINRYYASDWDYLIKQGPSIAEKHYLLLLDAAESLIRKGREADGTEIRQTSRAWKVAITYGYTSKLKEATLYGEQFKARLVAIAKTLVSIDKTVTRTKMDIKVGRVTQNDESDLAFLHRVSEKFGILFSVRDDSLIFTSRYDLEEADPSLTLTENNVVSYDFTDKATKVYSGVRVKWHDPESGEIVESVTEADDSDQGKINDVLEVTTKVETQAQADEVAKAALQEVTSKEIEGTLNLEGRPLMVAGTRVFLEGFGVLDGKWMITESSHSVSPGSGYTTTLRVKRGR